MASFPEVMDEYKRQLAKGKIQDAYKGLMNYISNLKSHFAKTYPSYPLGSTYYGFMDMTYFALFSPKLKSRKLNLP
jgi:hypothetical protein